jgi:hypothetical protein
LCPVTIPSRAAFVNPFGNTPALSKRVRVAAELLSRLNANAAISRQGAKALRIHFLFVDIPHLLVFTTKFYLAECKCRDLTQRRKGAKNSFLLRAFAPWREINLLCDSPVAARPRRLNPAMPCGSANHWPLSAFLTRASVATSGISALGCHPEQCVALTPDVLPLIAAGTKPRLAFHH